MLSQCLAAEGQDDSRVAWMSLEPDDRDLRRFLTRVVAALADRTATFGTFARRVTHSAWNDSPARAMSIRSTDSDLRPNRFLLVRLVEASFAHRLAPIGSPELPSHCGPADNH